MTLLLEICSSLASPSHPPCNLFPVPLILFLIFLVIPDILPQKLGREGMNNVWLKTAKTLNKRCFFVRRNLDNATKQDVSAR